MKRKWFKAKSYGYGWTPATWEGWVITIVFVSIYIASGLVLRLVIKQYPTTSSTVTLFFSLWMILLTLILLFISYKTGEKPYWRWGEKKDTNTV